MYHQSNPGLILEPIIRPAANSVTNNNSATHLQTVVGSKAFFASHEHNLTELTSAMLCCKKKVYHTSSNYSFKSSCQIPVIFGTVIAE